MPAARSPFRPPAASATRDPDQEIGVVGPTTFRFMREVECSYGVNHYMLKQPKISPRMRAILFDWMVEVCQEFALKRQTWHMATNYTDRYLATSPSVEKEELQLIGVTALFISAKLEEIYPPRASDFALTTGGAFSKRAMFLMEQQMLRVFAWRLNPPTGFDWVNIYIHQCLGFAQEFSACVSEQKWGPIEALSDEECLRVSLTQQTPHNCEIFPFVLLRRTMEVLDFAMLDIG